MAEENIIASTYSSNLGIEMPANGDQSGTWGTTVNTNLGTLIEQAISGYVGQAITDGADTTITIPNGATGVARNMFLELTGALTGARNLIVPANKKLYFVYNNTTGGYAVTVKVTGLTGVAVPNGAKLVLVSNGTDIVAAITAVGTAGVLGVLGGGTGLSTGTSGGIPAFTASGTITSSAALTQYALVLGGGAGAVPVAMASIGTTTTVLHGNASGAPTFGAVSLTADVSGTLPVANGGTGATTLTANNVVLGNGTSAVQFVAPGTSGNVLTSNGTTWTSAVPSGTIVQVKYTQSQAVVVGAGTAIPYDNTIPQITEGDLFLTAPAITPTNASNLLRVTVQFSGTENTNSSTYLTVAVFQDSTANAVAVMTKDGGGLAGTVPNPMSFVYYMVAGATAATTFTVRAGLDTANPVCMNGNNSATLFGGKLTSSITVEEIKV